jgi:hypothetical protein
MTEHSFKNFHVKGFDYLCIKRTPDHTRKVYFFDGNASQLPDVVHPHDHRYDFKTTILTGVMSNSHYTIDEELGKVYNEFEWRTPLNGGDGFKWKKETKLFENQRFFYRPGESYDMALFENRELETYLYDAAMKSGAIAVEDQEKTVYDYVAVDSEVEYNFMKSLEDNDDVKFYIKLPNWFKIDTPVGTYNPDWAVVFDGDKRVYFVAETKGTNDINDESLRGTERGKILAGQEHFAAINVPYVAPISSLNKALDTLRLS